MNMLRLLILAILMSSAFGCGGGVRSLSYSPIDVRPDFLVEVKTAPPAKSTKVVNLSVVAIDPGGPMASIPVEGIVSAMRKAAAERGAHFLLVEKLDSRWRRVYHGTGLKLSPANEAEITRCEHTEAQEALADVVKAAGRCLQGLSRSRPSLRARLQAKLIVDGFGGLKSVQHQPGSSLDAMVRRCLLKPAARATYGLSGRYFCELSVDVELK